MTGNHKGFRDCHIKPDLVLIYRVQSDTVDFVRLGSHSEVFD
ncbi:type II toxin-antitoxin system RelE/ParE family toxin [Psychrobacter aquimaris]